MRNHAGTGAVRRHPGAPMEGIDVGTPNNGTTSRRTMTVSYTGVGAAAALFTRFNPGSRRQPAPGALAGL